LELRQGGIYEEEDEAEEECFEFGVKELRRDSKR